MKRTASMGTMLLVGAILTSCSASLTSPQTPQVHRPSVPEPAQLPAKDQESAPAVTPPSEAEKTVFSV